MTLMQYAEALKRTGRPSDARIARYIETHKVRISGWIRDSIKTLGRKATRSDREDLMQIALLAITKVCSCPDADTALNEVKNELQNAANRTKAWNKRRVGIADSELDAPVSKLAASNINDGNSWTRSSGGADSVSDIYYRRDLAREGK